MVELLAVRRPLIPASYPTIKSDIQSLNRRLPDYVSLKWNRLERIGVSMVNPDEFLVLSRMRKGIFSGLDMGTAKQLIEYGLDQAGIAQSDETSEITDADFFGFGRFVNIAYLLEPEPYLGERDKITSVIDKLNGVNFNWLEMRPHATVATIERRDADQSILDLFLDIKPAELSFSGAKVVVDESTLNSS